MDKQGFMTDKQTTLFLELGLPKGLGRVKNITKLILVYFAHDTFDLTNVQTKVSALHHTSQLDLGHCTRLLYSRNIRTRGGPTNYVHWKKCIICGKKM